MPPRLALTTPVPALRPPSARLAVYGALDAPPMVRELTADGPGELVEALFAAAAEATAALPVLAVREVIENLVHAAFADALVSVLDGGRTLRVADHGPGIAEPQQALEPGVSGAGPAERAVVRGVGCGLPLARAVIEAAGGSLELAANLGAGTAVTLALPEGAGAPAAAAAPADAGALPEGARLALALLLELEVADPQRLAAELGSPLPACGRDLVLLEHHGLVAREPAGGRRLTPQGAALVETLF